MKEGTARLVCLDVFRGLTIFCMIVVNTPGAGTIPFPQLLHANWHGFTLTDLVFPSFLFAVGTAIPFAEKKWAQLSQQVVWAKILRRTALIFIIGWFLNWYTGMHWNQAGQLEFPPFFTLRISGVLQRIAVCYFLAMLVERFSTPKQIVYTGVLILLGYWGLLYFGGDQADPYSIGGNLVRKIDLLLIGETRMYREAGFVFDPEGILSSFPATVNVLVGILAGREILQQREPYQVSTNLLVAGGLLLLAGLCWSFQFPLNKKLWTSSFVLVTSGIDLLAMGVLYYFQEIRGIKTGTGFFSVPGKNPLIIYIFSNLLLIFFILPFHNTDLYTWVNLVFFQYYFPGAWGSLLFAVAIAMLCWSVAWMLDKKKIYIRV